jgi:hypothetical protein
MPDEGGRCTMTNRRVVLESRESSIGDVKFEESGSQRSAAVYTAPQRRHPTYVLQLAAILLQRSKKPNSWILASWFYKNLVCILDAGLAPLADRIFGTLRNEPSSPESPNPRNRLKP